MSNILVNINDGDCVDGRDYFCLYGGMSSREVSGLLAFCTRVVAQGIHTVIKRLTETELLPIGDAGRVVAT